MDFVLGKFNNPELGNALAKDFLGVVYDLDAQALKIEQELKRRIIAKQHTWIRRGWKRAVAGPLLALVADL